MSNQIKCSKNSPETAFKIPEENISLLGSRLEENKMWFKTFEQYKEELTVYLRTKFII